MPSRCVRRFIQRFPNKSAFIHVDAKIGFDVTKNLLHLMHGGKSKVRFIKLIV